MGHGKGNKHSQKRVYKKHKGKWWRIAQAAKKRYHLKKPKPD